MAGDPPGENSSPPSSYVSEALRLGSAFQGAAPEQNEPQSGVPFFYGPYYDCRSGVFGDYHYLPPHDPCGEYNRYRAPLRHYVIPETHRARFPRQPPHSHRGER